MLQGKLLTAIALDDAAALTIERRFAALLGEAVSLTQEVQPELLGGIKVLLGGTVYDDSVQGRLSALRATMLAETRRVIASGAAGATAAEQVEAVLRERLQAADAPMATRGVGEVFRAGDGIATVSGLHGCRYGELLDLGAGAFGIAMNLNEQDVDVVLLSHEEQVRVGDQVLGTGQVLSVPVGDAVIGRVVNPLGQPIDEQGDIQAEGMRPIEAPAPAILDRQPVSVPLETGLLAIDASVPIGRGQRELIIGDRQTGKTSVATDTVLNQKGKGVLCIYVAIGQKVSTVAQVIETFRQAGAMAYTAVVCSTASDSPTMQYIAPYCGCAIAEHFMYTGRDVLVVYDDLSKHAVAYRAMSLLLRRPPGREAYPGDVFYLHSRLLERAARLSDALGGGSMTALPIIETQIGDISAYIPTNVISITDGQIFLDAELFRAGTRPALNVGLSVSRVGGAAQTKAMRKVAGQLRLELAQYRELLVFSQFSSDMDMATSDMLAYGARLAEMLKQRNNAPLDTAVQVCLLYAMSRGLIPHDIPMAALLRFKEAFPALLEQHFPALMRALRASGQLTDGVEEQLHAAVAQWLAQDEAASGAPEAVE